MPAPLCPPVTKPIPPRSLEIEPAASSRPVLARSGILQDQSRPKQMKRPFPSSRIPDCSASASASAPAPAATAAMHSKSDSPPTSPSPPKIQRTLSPPPAALSPPSHPVPPMSAFSNPSSPSTSSPSRAIPIVASSPSPRRPTAAADSFLVRTQSPTLAVTSMSSPLAISGSATASTSTGASPALSSSNSSTSPMLDFTDYDLDQDFADLASSQSQVLHMDPESQTAFDSILAAADADTAHELAQGHAQRIPQPFRAWVAAAVVADRLAEKPLSVADQAQIKSAVDQAWELGMKASVARETWMAVAMHVEHDHYATQAAAMLCDKAVQLVLGESSSGANMLSADAEQLIDSGAIHCARTLLLRATLQYPTSLCLWKQYIQFESEHGSPAELSSVTDRAGRVCPAALKVDDDDDDDDDMYGQSVTISHNPLMSSMDRMRDDSDDDNAPHPALMDNESLYAFDNRSRSLLHTTPTPTPGDDENAPVPTSPFAPAASASAVGSSTVKSISVTSFTRTRPSVSKAHAPLSTTASPSASAAAPPPARFNPPSMTSSYSLPPAQPVTPGLRGLQNLGNTCFMNSALQCMSNTPFLTQEYFNAGKWVHEVNPDNPLGMQGAMAKAYAALMKALWSATSTDRAVAPRHFKAVMAQFAPQFSGYQQHDSSELLGFLLDGLHEDLNRVKKKPYIEAKDDDGRPDDEVANEQWAGHRARNDSIIVDMFQGQYKSRVQCSVCQGVSLTFDPYMVVTLPIPTAPSLVPINVVAVGLGGRHVAKARVWVKKDGSVGELGRAVEEKVLRGKLGAAVGDIKTKCVVVEWYMNKVHKRFFDLEDVSGITPHDEIWVLQVPAKDGDVPPGLPVDVVLPRKPIPEAATPVEDVPANGMKDGQVVEEVPVGKPVAKADADDAMDVVPASAPASRAGSPMAVDDNGDANANKPKADEDRVFVPAIIVHQKGKLATAPPASKYSYMSMSGTGFGLPTVAYLASPFDPAQAAAAVIASVERWTTFPLRKYLETYPDVDPASMIKLEIPDPQSKWRRVVLKAGDQVGPTFVEVACTWEQQVADNVFADPPFPASRAAAAAAAAAGPLQHPNIESALLYGPQRAPSTGSTSAAAGAAGAGLSDVTMDDLSDLDAGDAKQSNNLTASVADSGVASEDTGTMVSKANGHNDENLFEGYHLFNQVPDLGPINPPATTSAYSGRQEYTLDQCFDGFVAEEHLGANDPVYCRKCKQHQEASKKVDLWRLPQVLVIALKRFGSGGGRYRRDKIDAMVDCPHVLDLKDRVQAPGEQGKDQTYELFAISNHFGGLGGGHYTAYAQNPNDRQWYEFDDSRVSPVSADQVVSPASYVLFYRKRGTIDVEIPEPVSAVSEEDAKSMMSQDPEVGMGWGSGAGGWNSSTSGYASSGGFVPPSGGFSSAYGAAGSGSSSSLTLSLRKKTAAAASSSDSLTGLAPDTASTSTSSLLSTSLGFKPVAAGLPAPATPAKTTSPSSPTNLTPFSGAGHRLDGGPVSPMSANTGLPITGAVSVSPGSRAMEMDSDTEDEIANDPTDHGYEHIRDEDAMDISTQVPDRAPQA